MKRFLYILMCFVLSASLSHAQVTIQPSLSEVEDFLVTGDLTVQGDTRLYGNLVMELDTGERFLSGDADGDSVWIAPIGVNATNSADTDSLDKVFVIGDWEGTNAFHLVVDSTGKVGVGTANSTANLHIYRSTAGTGATLLLEEDGAGDAAVRLRVSDAFERMLGADNDDADKFKISGSSAGLGTNDRFTIDGNGNIGVGTASPIFPTEINGIGQAVATLTDAGARGGTLSLIGNSGTAGMGGAIVFGNSQSVAANSVGWAAIKGLLTSGASNTTGDLAFSTRNAAADVALT